MQETDAERKERVGLSSVEATEMASAAVAKTPNRVTLDSMLTKIVDEEYLHPESIPHMTICVLVMKNGFGVVGKAAPADAANFNEELGHKFSKEDAVRQLWALEGFALRERLSSSDYAPADTVAVEGELDLNTHETKQPRPRA